MMWIFLISRAGHFIASTLDQGIEDGNEHSLRTQHLANSTYNELFKELHASRMQQQLVLSKDPNDNEPYYFMSAPIPTGEWLVITRDVAKTWATSKSKLRLFYCLPRFR